jgi:nucleoside-diphosphate-sugar epimerase
VSYCNKRVLVTGGLGFIGSNLTIRLVREGARVTVADSRVIGCGANSANLEPVFGAVDLIETDIGYFDRLRDVVRSCDVIFNLAGEISHVHSMLFPVRDLEINTMAQLRFLQGVVEAAPGIRVLYAGTRQVYGIPEYLPVNEKHPVNPVDFNGVHKYAATMYHLMLARMGLLDSVVLRLTNVYGPRMALDTPCQGFLSTYLRKAITGQTLEIYGDGRQLRDPLYVDEAVDAMLLAGAAPQLASRSYNIGGPEPLSLAEIAATTSCAGGLPPPVHRDFPEERKAIDIGSYYTDSTRFREDIEWKSEVRFADGIRRTIAYYRDKLDRYLDVRSPEPSCKLGHETRTLKPSSVVSTA